MLQQHSPSHMAIDTIAVALLAGQSVVVAESEYAVLAFNAATATTEQLDFAIRYSSGLVFALATSARLDQLRIPDQQVFNSEKGTAPLTVAVDAASGITTGISAHDRAHTLRTLADPAALPRDLIRPGHVLPMRCLSAETHPERNIWDAILTVLKPQYNDPVMGACHLVDDHGELLNEEAAVQFAAAHDLTLAPAQTLDPCETEMMNALTSRGSSRSEGIVNTGS